MARTSVLTPEVTSGCKGGSTPEPKVVGGLSTTLGEVKAATDGTPYALDPEVFNLPDGTAVFLCVVDPEGKGNLPPGITRLTLVNVPDGVNTQSAWVDGF